VLVAVLLSACECDPPNEPCGQYENYEKFQCDDCGKVWYCGWDAWTRYPKKNGCDCVLADGGWDTADEHCRENEF
jgi:hypothetical protein